MKKRSIIIYWLLILIPAFTICLAAGRLLLHEQERITRLDRSSRAERAQTIAETLQITIETVEDELQQALVEIPKTHLVDTLLNWEATNPLIRNVFVWDETAGLEYPLPGMASTAEERRFMDRFDGLFSGRIPWASDNRGDNDGRQHVDRETAGKITTVQKARSGRRELVDMIRSRGAMPGPAGMSAPQAITAGGWVPWFVENRLYILGWVKTDPTGPVYGVELELMTLLSRLIADFPGKETESVVYALKDDSGRILHQIGDARIDRQTIPESIVSLSPQLPHWELAVYPAKNEITVLSGRGFLFLSGLLLFIFLAAILLGGAMLTWQAHRNQKDALEKTSFVSNVSHELKTPLTSIRMYAELLSGGRVTDPEKTRHYLRVIVSETRRLTRLVNNVLDFSRLEQGRKKYHFEVINLTGRVREVLSAQSLPIQEAGMDLEGDLPGTDITVFSDRDSIDQVMVNLIDNAVKYAADGRVLKISMGTNDDRAWIEVADRGPGVPQAHRERIFEQFHRVDDSLTARQQGTGLGLSIARRILRDLGGDLLYRAGNDGGSCFVMSLPIYTKDETSKD